MKRIITLGLCLWSMFNLNAQIFFTESFETTGDYTLVNAGDCSCVTADVDATDGQNDYFRDVVDNDISANASNDYTGERDINGNIAEGTARYWAVEDNDDNGVGGSGNATLCLNLEIDIIGKDDLQFSAYFGGNEMPFGGLEPEDFIMVSTSIDGRGFVELLDWRQNADGQRISLDTDGDNLGDGTFPLGVAFQQVTAPISGTGTTLIIQICANSNSSGEEFAVDHIQIEENVTVPVELLSFEAETVKNDVQLTWITASESDNYGFEVERSTDGKLWETIDFVKGNGNSLSNIKYQYLDKEVARNLNYYRLKQIDFDGDFEHSNIVNAAIETPFDFNIYPNPVGNQLNITTEKETTLELIVQDSEGRTIAEKRLESHLNFDTSTLPKGTYFITLKNGKRQHKSRFIKL